MVLKIPLLLILVFCSISPAGETIAPYLPKCMTIYEEYEASGYKGDILISHVSRWKMALDKGLSMDDDVAAIVNDIQECRTMVKKKFANFSNNLANFMVEEMHDLFNMHMAMEELKKQSRLEVMKCAEEKAKFDEAKQMCIKLTQKLQDEHEMQRTKCGNEKDKLANAHSPWKSSTFVLIGVSIIFLAILVALVLKHQLKASMTTHM